MMIDWGQWGLWLLAVLVLGLALGGADAWRKLRPKGQGAAMDEIRNGQWTTSLVTGSKAADNLSRARIAIYGLLALDRKETVYYMTGTDDRGEPLTSDRDYVIEGQPLRARWWSITPYDMEMFLIDNEEKRSSFHMDNIEYEPDGRFRILLSGRRQARNWLPTGKAGPFCLTLRLYNPDMDYVNRPGQVVLPVVRRIEGDAA
ncbi:MAG: DUF1214 domain-containing protein [Alphaproteobacteria bacterium]|nr:DUF1214 domain-containing protein [Alphaproteobacteria bacterium]